MSKGTVKDYIQRTMRVLINTSPPYLEAVSRNGHKFDNGRALSYRVLIDIRKVTPKELLSGIHKLFPEGITDEVAANYRHYKLALISLGRYFVYEMTNQHGRNVWEAEDLDVLRELLPKEKVVYAQVEIMDPALFDEFLSWMLTASPPQEGHAGYRELHDLAFALRWMGYRYSGARLCPVKLDGKKTVRKGSTKLSRGLITITEKPPNPVRSYQAPDIVLDFLRDRRAYMKGNWPQSEYLFCTTRGTQWNEGSGSFNTVLRRAFTRFHLEVKGTKPEDVDLEACHAHALRHICGTYMVQSGVDFSTVKNYLGHKNFEIMELYVGHVSRLKGAAALMNEKFAAWEKKKENGNHASKR